MDAEGKSRVSVLRVSLWIFYLKCFCVLDRRPGRLRVWMCSGSRCGVLWDGRRLGWALQSGAVPRVPLALAVSPPGAQQAGQGSGIFLCFGKVTRVVWLTLEGPGAAYSTSRASRAR